MMAVRTRVRLALVIGFLVAVAIVVSMPRSGALPLSFWSGQLHSGPAVAPATVIEARPAATLNGAAKEPLAPSSLRSATPADSGGSPAATVGSGGPADAGPGVAYTDQVRPPASCGPKPCPR